MRTISVFGQQFLDLSTFGTIATGTTVAGLYEYILKRLDTRKIFTLLLNGKTYDMSNHKIVKSLNAVTDKDEIKITYDIDASYEYYIIVDESGAVTIDKTAISGGGGGDLDVNIENPLNGEVLAYNSTTEKWENTSLPVKVVDTNLPTNVEDLSTTTAQGGYQIFDQRILSRVSPINNLRGDVNFMAQSRKYELVHTTITVRDNVRDVIILAVDQTTGNLVNLEYYYDGQPIEPNFYQIHYSETITFNPSTSVNPILEYTDTTHSLQLSPTQEVATFTITSAHVATDKYLRLLSDSTNFVAIYSDTIMETQTFGHNGFDFTLPIQNALADKIWTPISLVSNGVGTETKFLINAQYLNDYTVSVSLKQDV